MTFDFGNPTRNTGYFFENMEGKFRHRYIRVSIDSRTVFITNKTHFKRMVEDYGEDSDYVKVRCRGLFPSLGSMQFISTEDAMASMTCPDLPLEKDAPLILGIDVARYGDDESVIYPRLGRNAREFEPKKIT